MDPRSVDLNLYNLEITHYCTKNNKTYPMEIILDAYGTFVQMKNKMVLINPKDKENIYVPLDKINTVIVTPGIRITSDVLFTLIHHDIDVIMQSRNGDVKGRIWNNRFGSIADIRKNQLKQAKNELACRWVTEIISRKILNQKNLMSTLYQENLDKAAHPGKALEKMEGCLNKLDLLPRHSIPTIEKELRNIEARAAQYYWSWMKSLFPKVYQFPGRITRQANDPVNSMLSYGYGMFYHKIESAIIKSGLDPQIGWFHVNQFNKPVLAYDLIEPFRVWVDEVVVNLCLGLVIPKALFKYKDGKCEMTRPARKILSVSVNKFLDQATPYKGKKYKRGYQFFLEAQNLATMVKTTS